MMQQLLVVLSIISLIPYAYSQACCDTYRVTASSLRLRSSRNTFNTSNVVGSMTNGAVVLEIGNREIVDTNGQNWTNLRFDDTAAYRNGFASIAFVVFIESLCGVAPGANCSTFEDYISYTSTFLQGKESLTLSPHTLRACTTALCGFPISGTLPIHVDVVNATKDLYTDLLADKNISFSIISGARTFDQVNTLWNTSYNAASAIPQADRTDYVLQNGGQMPGASRLHWGADLVFNALNNSYFESGDGLILYNWLLANASKYGFCQPYPAGRLYGLPELKYQWSYKSTANVYLRRWLALNYTSSGFQGSQFIGNITGNLFQRSVSTACLSNVCDVCTPNFGPVNSTLFCACCAANCSGLYATSCAAVPNSCLAPPSTSAVPTSQTVASSSASNSATSSAATSSAATSASGTDSASQSGTDSNSASDSASVSDSGSQTSATRAPTTGEENGMSKLAISFGVLLSLLTIM